MPNGRFCNVSGVVPCALPLISTRAPDGVVRRTSRPRGASLLGAVTTAAGAFAGAGAGTGLAAAADGAFAADDFGGAVGGRVASGRDAAVLGAWAAGAGEPTFAPFPSGA